MKKIAIWGASGGAEKDANIFRNLDIDFECFIDNDPKKWGSTFCDKLVYSPEKLYEGEYQIIIASQYQKEIEAQLLKMNMKNSIVLKEQYIINYVMEHMCEFEKMLNDVHINNDRTYIFDIPEGNALGGIENWTFDLCHNLIKRKQKVRIIAQKTDYPIEDDLENYIDYVDLNYNKYWIYIKKLVEIIANNLPCVVIDSWQRQITIAAAIVKKYYPEKIKVLSIVHNDYIRFYSKVKFMEKYEDAIAGVSKRIVEKLSVEYNIPSSKLFYKESSVFYDTKYKKKYNYTDTLEIGFAARITKLQKRADLIIPLLEMLKGMNVRLNIAGDGDYFNQLKEKIINRKYGDNVKLYGKIPKEKMPGFWKKMDVFVSLSEFEGVGLSMLEAMSYGVVPIDTNVAGAEEFITERNGFIYEFGELEKVVSYIRYLEENRSYLEKMGEESRKIIKRKCNQDDYSEYIMSIFK